MSESMAAEIMIGGRIRRSVAEVICPVIARQGVALDWGEAEFRPQTADELLAACCDNGDGVELLRLYDDQARWGEFDALEQFLRNHKIAYLRYSEGKYDFDPQAAAYHPDTGPLEWVTDHNSHAVIKASELRPIANSVARLLAAVRGGKAQPKGVERTLKQISGKLGKVLVPEPPLLTPFEIVGD
jgi:hypothetical protein